MQAAHTTTAAKAPTIRYSVFDSVSDIKSMDVVCESWPDFTARIEKPRIYKSKRACPLLKLATFGDRANDKGSLRHDGNVDLIYGVEGDYDAELVSPAEAAERLRAAGVRAIVYTSASHTAAKPRWRVLAPLSAPVDPSMRAELVSLLNGALGGILAGESWVLSQTFYFGKVKGAEYETHVIDGEPLDVHAFCPSFDPIDPPTKAKSAVELATPRRKEDANSAEIELLEAKGWITAYREDGGVDVRCPRSEMHTADTGTSSTTYFPAGVGGRSVGGFECRHTSCGNPTTTEFWKATGLDALQSALLAREFEGTAPATDPMTGEVVPERPRFDPIPMFEFAAGPLPEWIVQGVLAEAEVSVIFGESGSGKSFFALDLVGAIARGEPWRGRKVKQGRVFYVAAEAAGGFKKRVMAYIQHHRIDAAAPPPLFVIADCPDLRGDSDWRAMSERVIEKRGKGAAVIVIDTLAQATAGGNENSGEDMGIVLKHCQKLSRETGALVLLIHHSGKDASKGARGWSGLRAAMDAEIEITREGDARGARMGKQKEDIDNETFGFTLKRIELAGGMDAERVTSCVVVHNEEPMPAKTKPVKALGGVQARVWEAVIQLQVAGPVPVEDVIRCAKARLAPPEKGTLDRRRALVKQALEALEKRALLRVIDGKVSTTAGADNGPVKGSDGGDL